MSAVTGIDLGALLRAISAILPSGLSRLWCVIQLERTDEQLIAQGKTVADVCRAIEVTQPTYHRWK